jgi:toxin CptA
MVVRVTLSQSRYLAAALLCAHIAAATVLLPLHLPVGWTWVLSLLIAASLGHSMRLHAWLNARRSLTAIRLHDREHASVRLRDGAWCDARVLGTTYISPLLTVINMRLGGEARTRHMLVLPDSLPADDYRRVRVALRWAHPAKAE